MPDWTVLTQQIIYGISYGMNLAIAASGLTLVFGVYRVVNLAHGQLIMLGGYVTYVVSTEFGAPYFVGLLAAMAAMGVAVLASPVMAQSRQEPWIPVSTENVFWGLAVGPVIHEGPAYGSVRPVAPGQVVPGPVYGAPPRILDCVHVTFPQCGGGGGAGGGN